MIFSATEGKLRMRLPCPSLGQDGACECYETRPTVCRTYNCKLQKRAMAGDISQSEAQEILREIKRVQHKAVGLATQALGKPQGYYPPGRISRAFRRMEKALRQKNVVNGFAARRALIERDRYRNLIKAHLQANYKG